MAEWLYEAGLGEDRAALVEDGHILAARISRHGAIHAGAIVAGRVAHILVKGRRAIVDTDIGDALLEPLPSSLAEGARAFFRVTREPIPEAGRPRLPKVVHAADALAPRPAPDLLAELRGGAFPVRELSRHGGDRLEAAGWSELIEEARTGEIDFGTGRLRVSPTPAMLLIDVDGDADPEELALAGGAAAARAIRRLDLGGSIGIDLPTVGGKAVRQAIAATIDALLPQPFERTGVNGFGFIQIVRPRVRASIVELVRGDVATTAALTLLRQAERTSGVGPLLLTLAPAVAESLRSWLSALSTSIGAEVELQVEPHRPIWSVDVHRAPL